MMLEYIKIITIKAQVPRILKIEPHKKKEEKRVPLFTPTCNVCSPTPIHAINPT